MAHFIPALHHPSSILLIGYVCILFNFFSVLLSKAISISLNFTQTTQRLRIFPPRTPRKCARDEYKAERQNAGLCPSFQQTILLFSAISKEEKATAQKNIKEVSFFQAFHVCFQSAIHEPYTTPTSFWKLSECII